VQPWKLQAKRYGFELTEVPFATPPKSPDDILNQFNDAITPRTRVITLAHITTVTGCATPVKELAKLCRSKGIYCLVDGAHTLGMIQYNLHDLGVDTYASPAHKWLCAPAGTGLLYVREGLIDKIWPNIVTQSWYQDKGARKYDRLSRRPWPQVAVLEDAIDYQLTIGRSRIESRCRGLAMHLRNLAAEIPGVILYTSNDPRLSAGMTTLGIKGLSGQVIHNYLRERYDIYVSPRSRGPLYPADPAGMDGVRVSTHYYNTFEQVDQVIQGLKELAGGRT
jgi:selenocysteine lyase/cysteine desulfurase